MKLSNREKTLLSVLLLLLVVAGGYFFGIRPLYAGWQAAQLQLQNAQAQQAVLEQAAAQVPELQSQLSELERQNAVLSDAYQDPMRQYQVDQYLQVLLTLDHLTASQLSVSEVTPVTLLPAGASAPSLLFPYTQDPESWGLSGETDAGAAGLSPTAVTVSLSVAGTMEDLTSFCDHIEHLQRGVKLTTLSIVQSTETPGQVLADLQLTIYAVGSYPLVPTA